MRRTVSRRSSVACAFRSLFAWRPWPTSVLRARLASSKLFFACSNWRSHAREPRLQLIDDVLQRRCAGGCRRGTGAVHRRLALAGASGRIDVTAGSSGRDRAGLASAGLTRSGFAHCGLLHFEPPGAPCFGRQLSLGLIPERPSFFASETRISMTERSRAGASGRRRARQPLPGRRAPRCSGRSRPRRCSPAPAARRLADGHLAQRLPLRRTSGSPRPISRSMIASRMASRCSLSTPLAKVACGRRRWPRALPLNTGNTGSVAGTVARAPGRARPRPSSPDRPSDPPRAI